MRVGVVGNGASSIIAVLSLLKKGVKRIEWYGGSSIMGGWSDPGGASSAFGVAYRTNNDRHLLNVEAGKMSPFTDETTFVEWIKSNKPLHNAAQGDLEGAFVPRSWYREYLWFLLRNSKVEAFKKTDTYNLLPKSFCHTWEQLAHLDKVILCLGASPRAVSTGPWAKANRSTSVVYPWDFDYSELDGIPARSKFLILGTGLTAIDAAISIWGRKPLAHIDFVSNHGRFPELHKPEEDFAAPLLLMFERLNTVRGVFLEQKSFEECGYSWRQFMSTTRSHWNSIWTRMDDRQRKIFLKHYKHLYDVHRHKMVPKTREFMNQHSYSLHTVDDYDWNKIPEYIFNATGISTDPRNNPLLVEMESKELCRFAPSRLGVITDQQCKVVGLTNNVWIVGAYLKDTFWECTAIPDIKNHIRIAVEDMTT